jgi:hypothetical protein
MGSAVRTHRHWVMADRTNQDFQQSLREHIPRV